MPSPSRSLTPCGLLLPQRKEIQDIIDALPQNAGDPASHGPRRLLRTQQESGSGSENPLQLPTLPADAQPSTSAQMNGGQEDMEQNDDSEDSYLALPALDILGKLGKDWPAKVLAASKWQTKKEMLDHLLALSSTPRLLVADYAEVRFVCQPD